MVIGFAMNLLCFFACEFCTNFTCKSAKLCAQMRRRPFQTYCWVVSFVILNLKEERPKLFLITKLKCGCQLLHVPPKCVKLLALNLGNKVSIKLLEHLQWCSVRDPMFAGLAQHTCAGCVPGVRRNIAVHHQQKRV